MEQKPACCPIMNRVALEGGVMGRLPPLKNTNCWLGFHTETSAFLKNHCSMAQLGYCIFVYSISLQLQKNTL